MSEFAIDAPGRAVPPTSPGPAAGTAPDDAPDDATRPADPAPAPGPTAGADPARALRLPAATALAAASGAALATAFPSLGWWPAAPPALAALALATRGQRPRRAAALGLLAGAVFFLPHLRWSGVYVGPLPWTALTLVEAAYLAGMAALFPLAWRAPGGRAGTVAALTGLWVAQEAVRGRVPFGGFPWARVAFSQSDAPTLGYAALGGAPLVTAAVAAAGACLAVATADLLTAHRLHQLRRLQRLREPDGPGQPGGQRARELARAVMGTLPALLTALAVLAGGAAVPRPATSDRSVAVAAVQGDVPEPGLDFNAERRAVLDNHARGTLTLARDVAEGRAERPDVVLWPENSSDIDPLRNPDARAVITQATDAVGVPVLVGAILAEPAPKVSNTAILWGPTGSTTPGPGLRYVKRHPAPFAEYVPYRSFFRLFSDKVDLVRDGFAAGRTVGVMPAGPARLGTVICFEVAYDDLVRDPVRAGADVLVVQTNNATFGYTDESVQQLAMSRLRAVETGRSVVHISTVGVSALITPDGREVTRSGHFTAQVLQARLPLRTGQTLAMRVGAAPEALLGLTGVALAAAAALRGRSRRARPADDAPADAADAADAADGSADDAPGAPADGVAADAGGTGDDPAGAGHDGEVSRRSGRDRGQELAQ